MKILLQIPQEFKFNVDTLRKSGIVHLDGFLSLLPSSARPTEVKRQTIEVIIRILSKERELLQSTNWEFLHEFQKEEVEECLSALLWIVNFLSDSIQFHNHA